jgi:hypothetical protein
MEEGCVERVLLNLDVDPDAVRREVVRRLQEENPNPFHPTRPGGESKKARRTGRFSGGAWTASGRSWPFPVPWP